MKQVFKVEGMSCGHCEKAITQALQQLDPLAVVKIDRASKQVEVESFRDRTHLANVITEEGYTVAADGH